ncbi:TetR/AcrR family transcriptional regulator [Nocardia abscessus]|uniref:TetR/AcrR family transcriptional regulator n=1 Tax=Nocardia abscessus TaxID=120957 RepID=UPI0018961CC8|nr:TetR/AcrR family transcriptional regulator [Nocardia abscessus]MBF6336047.1 TetR/AcrR family transcriptional regulator [Nocardia abscessus]
MPADTRTALLDSAIRLLDAGGVEAVTLREVGLGAGVSHNAPYKHFASKEALLAAIAARELTDRAAILAGLSHSQPTPVALLREVLHTYIAWALTHPARFKLVFGAWTIDSPELAAAANAAQDALIDVVARCQASDDLPPGDPIRLAALLRALAHGAADLAAAGHLAADGKGNADATDLVDDLLAYLRPAS